MNDKEVIPMDLRKHFVSVFNAQSVRFTEEIRECRLLGRIDVAARLYQAADLLEAIDLEAPGLTWNELFARTKVVTDLHDLILEEERRSANE